MLEVVALGGLGEFGMNMLALSWGETTVVVDAGVMFPDPELLGVDRIIPDLTYLQQKGRVAALVLTHGHEDHIGGAPHVVPLVDGPIYGTPLTLALVEPKLEEHGIEGAQLVAVRPRSEEHTSELQSRQYLVCRLLLEKKKQKNYIHSPQQNKNKQDRKS